MDRLDVIATFVRVAELSSFTAAAAALGISRAVASDRVMQLEARLGVKLLNRTTRRVSLTEAGLAYLDRARLALATLEEAEQEASTLTARPRGVLRVNAPVTFGAQHVAPAVARFLALHPELGVELTLADRRVNLLEEQVDVAVRIGRLEDSSLVARRLAPCRSILCAAPAYIAARGMPEHPADLARHDCLSYAYAADGDLWRFERDGRQETVRVGSRIWSNNGEALAHAAIAGLGIALKPTFIVGEALRDGRLVPVMPGWNVPPLAVHAVWPPSRYLPFKPRAFIEHLASCFGPDPYWDRI
jgi:DNA-binding transcriptional LysR family regulator